MNININIITNLLQVLSDDVSSVLDFIKLSLKNFKKFGRFLIKLLLVSLILSCIWLSNNAFVAFDFILVAVLIAVVFELNDLPAGVPNIPIISNSYDENRENIKLNFSVHCTLITQYIFINIINKCYVM